MHAKAARLVLSAALLQAAPRAAAADVLFHIVEIVSEDEVRPRQAHHDTRWEGDYYVTDAGVSTTGWDRKGVKPPRDVTAVPFDEPRQKTNPEGLPYVAVYHRVPGGMEAVITYDSFVVERRIVQTGPQSCTATGSVTLRPGHDLYETRRVSNHEPMAEARRWFKSMVCTLPPLVY